MFQKFHSNLHMDRQAKEYIWDWDPLWRLILNWRWLQQENVPQHDFTGSWCESNNSCCCLCCFFRMLLLLLLFRMPLLMLLLLK
ncbi:hypothetical protein YC2023_037086 [Brassica napus]